NGRIRRWAHGDDRTDELRLGLHDGVAIVGFERRDDARAEGLAGSVALRAELRDERDCERRFRGNDLDDGGGRRNRARRGSDDGKRRALVASARDRRREQNRSDTVDTASGPTAAPRNTTISSLRAHVSPTRKTRSTTHRAPPARCVVRFLRT